jgi:hypothetical protein
MAILAPNKDVPIPFAGQVSTPKIAIYGKETQLGVAKFVASSLGAKTGALASFSPPQYGLRTRPTTTLYYSLAGFMIISLRNDSGISIDSNRLSLSASKADCAVCEWAQGGIEHESLSGAERVTRCASHCKSLQPVTARAVTIRNRPSQIQRAPLGMGIPLDRRGNDQEVIQPSGVIFRTCSGSGPVTIFPSDHPLPGVDFGEVRTPRRAKIRAIRAPIVRSGAWRPPEGLRAMASPKHRLRALGRDTDQVLRPDPERQPTTLRTSKGFPVSARELKHFLAFGITLFFVSCLIAFYSSAMKEGLL